MPTDQGGGDVVQQAVDEADLVQLRNVRAPEAVLENEGRAAHAPAVLLHEEAPRLVGAGAHGQAKRQVLDLDRGGSNGTSGHKVGIHFYDQWTKR